MRYLFALTAVIAGVAAAAIPAYGESPTGVTLITDTLGGNRHAKQVQDYRFITETLAPGGGAALPTAVAVPGNSFSWADAGVGAAAAVGALVALLGATLIAMQRHMRVAV